MPITVEQAAKQQAEDDRRLLDALAAIGGSRVADEDIERRGDKLIIPERWTPKDALRFLRDHIESQEEETQFSRTFRFRPYDGARALQVALRNVFGTAGIGKPIYTFFGKQPPEMISVQVGVNRTEQVPWGALAAPLFGGTIYTGVHLDPEYGPIFSMTVETKRKYKAHVEGLFEAVAEVLRTESIYKGQAINGAEQPEFLDLRGVDPSKVVYSNAVSTQISANVWSLLRYTDEHRERGLPLKRAVLFEGDYGTGKTLAAFLTAQLAVEKGWTFVYCRPGKDDLDMVMNTARLYQPSVVFFEDVDTIASTGEADRVTRLLDVFDGITAKGTELLCILTTNHKEQIHKGMVRPGRLDAVIAFEGLDVGGVERMVRSIIPQEELADDLDFDAIAKAMGVGTELAFLPAFAKEAIDRAARYALDRSGGAIQQLTTEDFVDAANGLVPQLELMRGAGEGIVADPLAKAMRSEVTRAVGTILDGTTVERGGAEWAALKSPSNGHGGLKALNN
jgi:transitional endoplasmic reticulum ATPase